MPLFPSPETLKGIEFARIVFDLEFQEAARFDAGYLLRLRRNLRQLAGHVLSEETGQAEAFAALFDPPLPDDPVGRKRFQRPGPGFVIQGQAMEPGSFSPDDRLRIKVAFFGRAIQFLSQFALVLEATGQSGLFRDEGVFDIGAINGEDSAGQLQLLWLPGDSFAEMTPPLRDAHWWITSRQPAATEYVELSFITPARLMAGGRPLFRPSFSDLFPFILRRVTSMAYAHCGIELIEDPAPLLMAARQVEVLVNELKWHDWRRLEGEDRSQDIGGVFGRLRLAGAELEDVLWLLQVAELLQLGKGAAYGAGAFRLS